MSTNFTLDEKIHLYLDNLLDTDSKLDFEKEMQQSPEIQETIANLKIAKYAVKHTALNASVKNIHQQYTRSLNNSTSAKPKVKRNWMMYTTAAAAAVAILIFFIWNNSPSTKTETADSLYATNYKHFEISNVRGVADKPLNQLFANKQYQETVAAFEHTATPSVEDMFITAMSQYELGALEKSKTLLQSVLEQNKKNNTILYKDDAEYYLGMANLKQHRIKEALAILEPIATNNKHAYSDVITPKFISNLKKLTP